jgi:hypothetical protein
VARYVINTSTALVEGNETKKILFGKHIEKEGKRRM